MASATSPDTMSSLDMFSELPDSVLVHILSFLPTKVAALTRLLSKRWKELWLSVSTLYFEEVDNADYIDHVDFVHDVYSLIFRRKSAPVEKFSLKFNYFIETSYEDANDWVKTALKLGAQHLELCLPYKMELLSAIIGSRTLVVLKLSRLSINTIVTNAFPSLKVLHLNQIVVSDDECLKDLLYGCPILEELFADGLILKTLSDDRGELQSLNNLVSADIRLCGPYIPSKWICKVKSLCLYEEFIPKLDFDCTFPNLTSLVVLIDHYNWSWLINNVLRNCPNLQHFEIKHMDVSPNALIDCNKCDKWPQQDFVPECLSTHLKTCTLREYQQLKCEQQFAKYIIQNAKVLCIMRICCWVFSDSKAKRKVKRKLSRFPKSSAERKIHLSVK